MLLHQIENSSNLFLHDHFYINITVTFPKLQNKRFCAYFMYICRIRSWLLRICLLKSCCFIFSILSNTLKLLHRLAHAHFLLCLHTSKCFVGNKWMTQNFGIDFFLFFFLLFFLFFFNISARKISLNFAKIKPSQPMMSVCLLRFDVASVWAINNKMFSWVKIYKYIYSLI